LPLVPVLAVLAGFMAGPAREGPAYGAAQQPAAVPQQPTEIGARITGDAGATPRYAVPDFIALTPKTEEPARMLAQVLWDDLSFEREFYMIPRDTYKTIPVARAPDQIAFDSWRELGADAVFFGTVQQKGEDLIVQVRLYNVRSRQLAFGQEYTVRARSARQIAHVVSDTIHDQQRGLKGVARTRLTFISDRNNESILGTVEKRTVKEVYVSDYDGANQQRITSSRHLNLNPSWTADGGGIAYSAYRGAVPEIFLSHIRTGVLDNLSKGRFRNGAYLPAVSPDGKQVLFHATADNAAAPDIYVMNIDGSNPRRLTTHPDADTSPTWSPSGTQIAFTSDRAGRPQVWVMNADGSGAHRLNVPDGETDRATWAPSPYNEIAFSARNGPGYDIKVHDLASGQTRQLTFSEGTNESPAYSPTGRHIAFTSTRMGNVQIFVMGRDGSGLRQLTRTGNNQTPDWSN
jgi:TolB protein